MTTASATLNPILARWLGPNPVETIELDCSNCARALKCCDFQPFVANFLLGASLEKGHTLPEPGLNFTYEPLGLIPSLEFRRRHQSTAAEQRGEDFLCAFYDRAHKSCSIWSERPGECSSYLCSEESLARKALSSKSFQVETGLSQMALAYQGFSPRQMADEIDFLNSPTERRRKNPEVFQVYRRAWEWVKQLSPKEVLEFLGETA